MNLETLYVEIKAQMQGFEKSINSVKSQLSTLDKTASKVSNSIQNSVNAISNSFTKLGKTLTKVISTVALIKLGKDALAAASDLEETQNVVNVAFGKSAKQIDEWAKHCLTAFGLTEYEAKTAAGSFKAMASSMGVVDDAGTTIALRLTELAGDLSSFYNTSNEVAKTALNSVFTGETETLKKFGVVMNEVNLKAYALSLGIEKSYSEMSQAEKVALRYKYVLSVTSAAQGDFIRSSNSWANQIKVLKGQWTSLMSVIGTALKQVLAPLIKALNTVVAALITAATALGKLFGIDFSGSAASVDSTADSASALNDDLDNATESAKKLKKTLAGFDELEILDSSDSSSSDSAIGDVAAGLEIEPASFDFVETNQKSLKQMLEDFNKFISDLDGKFVGLLSKFEMLGKSLAEKLNLIFADVDWNQLGTTVADGLNLVIGALSNFAQTLDGAQIGTSIANFFNNLFSTVHWDELTTFVIEKTNNIFAGLKAFTQTLDVSDFAANINNYFNRITTEINFDNLATAIGEGINKAFTVAAEVINSGNLKAFITKIFDTLNQIFATIDWGLVAKTVADGIIQFFQGLKDSQFPYQVGVALRDALAAVNIGELIGDIYAGLGDAFGNFIEGLTGKEIDTTKWGDLATKLLEIGTALTIIWSLLSPILQIMQLLNLSGFVDILGKLGTVIIPTFNLSLSDGFSVFEAWDQGIRIWYDNLNTNILTGVKNFVVKIKDYWTYLPEITKEIFGNMKFHVTQFIERFKTNALFFKDALINGITHPLESLKLLGSKLITGIKSLWGVLAANPLALIIAAIVALVAAIIHLYNTNEEFRAHVDEIIGHIKELLKDMWENHLKPLWDKLKEFLSALFKGVGSLLDTLEPAATFIVDLLGEVLEVIIEVVDAALDIFGGLIDFLTGVFTGDWKKAWEGIGEIFGGIWNAIVTVLKTAINAIVAVINGVIAGVVSALNVFLSGIKYVVKSIGGLIGKDNWGSGNWTISNVPQIPYLANGGVIDQPTLAMMGEYAGARNNPEIAVPQNTLEAIISSRNDDLIDAMAQMTRQVIGAVEDVDMSVTIGDDTIAQSAARGANNYKRRTGKALFAY